MKPNPAISQSRVSRRARLDAADQAAIARHQHALAALDQADKTCAIIDAMKRDRPLPRPMATRPEPQETRGPQEPARAIPDGGTVNIVDRQTIVTAQWLALAGAVTIGFILGKWL